MSREEYLNGLTSFIQSSDYAIKKFAEEMGWHWPLSVRREPWSPHVQSSEVLRDALDSQNLNEYSDEPLLPSASVPLPSSANFTITIDAETQRDLLLPYKSSAGPDTRRPPTSAGELTTNFTREERLAMYEHTIQNAAGVATPHELISMEASNPMDNQPKELSGLELMKAMRDFKRRRQAYRTKVSTKNKSQTQVTRELIHNMMVYLGVEELEHETAYKQGDTIDVPQSSSNQKKSVERKNVAPMLRHLHGKKDGRECNKYNDPKSRREHGGDFWNGQKRRREHETSRSRSTVENEREHGLEFNRDKRKYNKRKQGAEYHKGNHEDKRFKYESRWNESDGRSRGRKYDRCSEKESKLKSSIDFSYEGLHEDFHVKEHNESSTKVIAKLQRNKYESVRLEKKFDSLNCTNKKIKEEDNWDKILEKRRGEKEEYSEGREISSHESQSSYSDRDHKAQSSKDRRKQKLKKKKMKRKHKKKQKHKKDKHSWYRSESEESLSDIDYRYKTSKTDVQVKESSF